MLETLKAQSVFLSLLNDLEQIFRFEKLKTSINLFFYFFYARFYVPALRIRNLFYTSWLDRLDAKN